ncbi:PLP-dependent transferase [Collinsella sp. An2]|uniref:PLP-dependent transferase n=1 Tax=Collinsella sp. An2 TaxID=1965585 RepID=UPI001EF4CBD3|nr:PLP-dependent transferase [Collinsella sp. An2]
MRESGKADEMGVMQAEVAHRFADVQGARATWFSYARHTPDLLAKLGLIGVHDRLVVCADDFEPAFRELFRWNDPVFVSDPTPQAFLRASMDDPDSEEARLIPEGSPASYAHPAGIHADRLFWFVESEGCLGLRVPHIRALAEAAAAVGAIIIVDNTIPSYFGCNPISLGAHVVLEALDRVAEGRLEKKVVATSVARSVVGKGRRRLVSPNSEEAYRLLSFSLGDPDMPTRATALSEADVCAISDGMDSFAGRMRRHVDHAHAIAEYLFCHPAVGHVFYPGLKSHPDRALAPNVLLHGFGPAIDFSLQGTHDERMMVRHLRFLTTCTCSHRDARAGGALTRIGIAAKRDLNYLRLFAGTDDPLSIADSLDQALRLFCNPPEP